jgi:glutathione S-transferase
MSTEPTDAEIPTIYHFEGSRAFRVVWVCEELGLPYRLVYEPGDQLASLLAFRSFHPLMPISPVMSYRGQLVVESGAIIDILLALHGQGRLIPATGSPDFLFHTQWMHFAEGTALARMTTERMVAIATGTDVDKLPKGYRAAEPGVGFTAVGSAAVFDYVNDFLGKHAYFGGTQFSAADVMMEYAMRIAKLVVWFDTRELAAISAWRNEVEARPAYRRAVDAAAPGELDEYGIPKHSPHPFTRPLPA